MDKRTPDFLIKEVRVFKDFDRKLCFPQIFFSHPESLKFVFFLVKKKSKM